MATRLRGRPIVGAGRRAALRALVGAAGLAGLAGAALPRRAEATYNNGTPDSTTGGLTVNGTLAVGNGGNLGVGVSAPNVPLQVHAPSTSDLRLSTANGSGAGGGLLLEFGTGGGSSLDASLWNQNNGYLRFGTGNVERARMAAGGGLAVGSGYVTADAGADNAVLQGSLGVGTAIPVAKLEVVGGVQLSGLLRVHSPSTSDLRLSTGNGSGLAGGLLVEFGTGGGSSLDATVLNLNNGSLRLGTNNTEVLRLDSTGNLGVGTPTPAAKLDVAGNGRFSGSLLLAMATGENNPRLVYYDGDSNHWSTSYLSVGVDGATRIKATGDWLWQSVPNGSPPTGTPGTTLMRLSQSGDLLLAGASFTIGSTRVADAAGCYYAA